MSEYNKNIYPLPGQGGTTEENVTGEQNPVQQRSLATSKQRNESPGQLHNMPPQQYVSTNQPQMQRVQQQVLQPEYYPQPMPHQLQYASRVSPQFYQQPGGPEFQSPVQPMPGTMNTGQSPYPFLGLPLEPWTTHLFDCAQDMENCLITTFFPCITFGQIAEITDKGASSCAGAGLIYGLLMYFTAFHWVYSWMYRTRLRASYNLMEDPFHDCLVHFFCDPCALCQEYRELKNRGFNMQLGWIGNMQLQAQMEAVAVGVPPPVQGMTR